MDTMRINEIEAEILNNECLPSRFTALAMCSALRDNERTIAGLVNTIRLLRAAVEDHGLKITMNIENGIVMSVTVK